jgi:hypothetical protein
MARETGPVNKRLSSLQGQGGDYQTEIRYMGVARAILGGLKERLRMGNINVGAIRQVLPDGTEIIARTVLGAGGMADVDSVYINQPLPVSKKAPQKVKRQSHACVPGPDNQQFTPVIQYAGSIAAGINRAGNKLYTMFIPLASYQSAVYVHQINIYDVASLQPIGNFSLPSSHSSSADSASLVVDVASDTFSVSDYDNAVTGHSFMIQWDGETAAVSVYDASDALNSGIHLHFAAFLMNTEFGANGNRLALRGGDYDDNNFYWIIDTKTHALIQTITEHDSTALFGTNNPPAHTSPNGTVYIWNAFGLKPIYVYGGAGGSISPPPGASIDAPYQIVATAEETLYAMVTPYSGATGLYKYDKGWQKIDLPLINTFNLNGNLSVTNGLLHDPSTGATAVVMSDLSGAWILDGKDCQDNPIDPFFFKFEPGNPIVVAGAGALQFYDANLVMIYIANPGNTFTVGVYSIGQLKQLSIDAEEEVDLPDE